MLEGVRAVKRSVRSWHGDTVGSQLGGHRECGITVGALMPQLHEPPTVGERLRLEPTRMSPQLAHLDAESGVDLRSEERDHVALHRPESSRVAASAGSNRLSTGTVNGYERAGGAPSTGGGHLLPTACGGLALWHERGDGGRGSRGAG